MVYNLLSDISTLTTIPLASLQKLSEKGMISICEDVKDSLVDKKSICEIDIDIGKLLISVENDYVKYKFIPSVKLDKMVLDTITTGESPLQTTLEDTLKKRIMCVYKDLF